MNGEGGFMLDTNILVVRIPGNPLGRHVDAAYGLRASLNRSMISVVTVGEISSLTREFAWGKTKVEKLELL